MKAEGELKRAILDGIYGSIQKPEEITLERVYFYDEWNGDGELKRGCVSIYHKTYDKKEEIKKTHIITYHIRMRGDVVNCYQNNKVTENPEVSFKISVSKKSMQTIDQSNKKTTSNSIDLSRNVLFILLNEYFEHIVIVGEKIGSYDKNDEYEKLIVKHLKKSKNPQVVFLVDQDEERDANSLIDYDLPSVLDGSKTLEDFNIQITAIIDNLDQWIEIQDENYFDVKKVKNFQSK
jgi:hypothetical protein